MEHPDGRPGVLFDVDGTLLDTNYLHVLAWWQALRDAGHGEQAMATIHRAIGLASAELVRDIIGEEDQDAVAAHTACFARLRDRVVAFPRAAELLAACADRGRAVVLVTSGSQDDLAWMLPAIGAGDAVHGVTTSTAAGASKPAPDPFEVALRDHGLDRDRCVVVGDTVWDVQAARKAGLECVALACGGICSADLRAAGAGSVYDDPADLLARLDDSPLADRPGGSAAPAG